MDTPDYSHLLDGVDDWDIDFLTPKRSPTKKKLKRPCERRDDIEDFSHLLDGVEDWDVDFLSPKRTPSKKGPKIIPRAYKGQTVTRCAVHKVDVKSVSGRSEKHLVVEVVSNRERRSVVLRDDWTETDVRQGDIINVLGDFVSLKTSSSTLTSTIAITTAENMLILHPDTLITATALSNASYCRRRPLLSGLVHASSDVTPSLVWGNILHFVMQAALVEERWDNVWMEDKIREVVNANLPSLLALNTSVDEAVREVTARSKGLQAFSRKYISPEPKPEANLTNTRATRNSESQLAITRVLDIEEDIWCPSHGIKGKIDATVETTISELPSPTADRIVTKGPKPFEVKTGRAIAGMEHRAQTMLYTVLAEKRYGLDVTSGLLYYTQSEEVVQVPVGRHELRGLIIYRNEMASYMSRRSTAPLDRSGSKVPFLPPTIDDERQCNRCYVLDTCMLYRKAVEEIEDSSSPIHEIYHIKTEHLTPVHTKFFKDWEHLIAMEESELGRFRKEIWTLSAAEREEKGRCFASMIIDSTYAEPESGIHALDNKFHQVTYKFKRSSQFLGNGSLISGFINVGDPITVSVEPHLIALSRGFVLELHPDAVVVGVDHELSPETLHERLHRFGAWPYGEIIFRIDKDELFGGLSRIRENLANLFYAEGDSKRRDAIVDLVPPRFSDVEMPLKAARPVDSLNENQRLAVNKVLSAEDYALILGMPGTGKTTVIGALIRVLTNMGKSVLLTSYTHSAVDTILLKLKDGVDFSVLRLGNVDKVHPDVRCMTPAAKRPPRTLEELERQVMTPLVVATTCLSLDQYLTSVKVRNTKARKGGLDVSLFRRLADAHPAAVVELSSQYRMNEDIMHLSNRLIYSDRLKCGSEEVARKALHLPSHAFLDSLHGDKIACHSKGCWLRHLMSESCKAVFVDTDLASAPDSRVGDLVQNEGEASLVAQTVNTLLRSGLKPDQIGVISLYRQQLKVIGQKLNHPEGLEMLTADRSQGRDKDCIVISMVRSNDDGYVGELVKDWRRINVSFTRAKAKLIIFGSRKTLSQEALLNEFCELMETRNWILRLPPGALDAHVHAFQGMTPKRARVGDEPDSAPLTPSRPAKKQKGISLDALARSRPLLKDLMNDIE
ncbi:Dna2-domain-containing protein [Cylindrobasidium torrendii FP15055 ss-10]|uniref:DNA replication ATP-dependent helicase/nuclease DNA2 n=1 Tax=Cylindrobasidium torrendii FP15055 ss-10 TaxID=1314674 RepID=A0A0D7BBF9_9AGAR|nr:Dna2-domain-containing protein [Cylindrobasidium torrendii FP15055 ss-10]